MITPTRVCSKCGVGLPLSENFYHHWARGDRPEGSTGGFAYSCKKCHYEYHKAWVNTLRGRLSRCLKRARIRSNGQCSVTLDELEQLYYRQDGKCALTGRVMETTEGHDRYTINPWSVSIDRLDSLGAYTADNIQLVCAIVNRMKTELDEDLFINLCEEVVNYAHQER